ncbi:TetR/AcrR family transcriptional regulator [Ferruginibacter lapsinanis]|uniref:TetR/AcrR family transcriptional regulator n=1 Tax=Ferruginibacter lapsinanis TaxID=563172 RepID=UPI001E45A9A7|nr:TetR/AcrR family transcriptional regulator [Ferruginibacter lapsinanis]UEG51057.1 TetR/AcrR family transcriptional regulator [Ferruginibacter lapsinanis]
MEIKDRIIEGAYELFIRYGFRSVSMDNIATKLGMSKKTLYQHFTDKDELVEAVMEYDITHDEKDCMLSTGNALNAIDEVLNVIDTVADQLSDMNPMVLYEMQKFHPKAFKIFQKHKDEFILKMITQNLHRGVTEGLYREDINIEVIAKFRLESMMLIFNIELFPLAKQYHLKDLMQMIGEHFLFGIVSPKGYKLIQKYQQERNKINNDAKK